MTDPILPNDPRRVEPTVPNPSAIPQVVPPALQGPAGSPPRPNPPPVYTPPPAPAPPTPPPAFAMPPTPPAGFGTPPPPPGGPGSIAPSAFGDTSFLNDTTTVQDRVDTSSGIVARVGLIAAAIAVAGGGAFAVSRALSEPAGAQSPEEAVTEMFAAVENEDVIGLTEMMLPSERESMVEPMIDLFAELERLELLDADYDPAAAAEAAEGLDFTVTGLDFTTTSLGEGVARADITAGVVTVTGDIDDIPFGDRADRELGPDVLSETINEEIVDFSDETDAEFVIVEEDGSWYVSFWYTVAEAARTQAGEPVPSFGAGVVPVGADSPEGAVRLMLEEAVDLDAEGVISSLDPSEFRALYDYAPLFLDDADAGVAELRQQLAENDVSWSLDRVDLSSGESRGRTVVQINGFAFSATGDGQSVSADFDGDCITIIVDQQIDETCIDEQMNGLELPPAYADFVEEYTSGITVVERDGRWYVSGMPTIIGAYTDLLASLEPQDIDEFTSFFKDSLDGALGSGVGDLFGGAGDFTSVSPEPDPFLIEEDPFFEEEEDPFFEEDDPFDYVQPDLTQDAIDTMLPGLDISASDADSAYFASATGFPATWYVWAYDFDTGASVEVVAFDVTAQELTAAMDESFAYERVDVPGLPEGAVAFDWPDVDRAVVIDNYIVSAYFNDDGSSEALLLRQVQAIADR